MTHRPAAHVQPRETAHPRVACEAQTRRGLAVGGRVTVRHANQPPRLALALVARVSGPRPLLRRRLPRCFFSLTLGCARGPCIPPPVVGLGASVRTLHSCSTPSRRLLSPASCRPRACGRHAGRRSSASPDTRTCQTEPQVLGLARRDTHSSDPQGSRPRLQSSGSGPLPLSTAAPDVPWGQTEAPRLRPRLLLVRGPTRRRRVWQRTAAEAQSRPCRFCGTARQRDRKCVFSVLSPPGWHGGDGGEIKDGVGCSPS